MGRSDSDVQSSLRRKRVKKRLLLYGLQRSGTNFLEALLKRVYRVEFLNETEERSSPSHKHFRLYDEKELVPEPKYRNSVQVGTLEDLDRVVDRVPDYYLVISKDPYSWLVSYMDWANKCRWSKVAHHYIVEYQLFYKRWLRFAKGSERVVFVRYIDLLADVRQELKRLESVMGLKRRIIGALAKGDVAKVPQSRSFSIAKRRYYLDEEYLGRYAIEEMTEVNALIGSEVLAGLGYERRPAGDRGRDG